MALDKDIIIQYALNELSTDEMERVKREIQNDPAAQKELKTYQLSLGDLDQKFQKLHDEPIPSDISHRIDQVASSLQRKPKKKIRFFPYFGTAAGGGLVGAIATAVYMTFVMMTPATVTFKGVDPADTIAKLEEQARQIDVQNVQIETLVAQLEKETSSMRSQSESRVAQLKNKITSLESELEATKAESGELRTQAAKPQILVAQLEKKVANLEQEIESIIVKSSNIGSAAIAKKSDKIDTLLALSFSDATRGACELSNKKGSWSGKVPGIFSISGSGGPLLFDCMTDEGKRGYGQIDSDSTLGYSANIQAYSAWGVIETDNMTKKIPELEKLNSLLDKDLITQEEYETKSKEIIEEEINISSFVIPVK